MRVFRRREGYERAWSIPSLPRRKAGVSQRRSQGDQGQPHEVGLRLAVADNGDGCEAGDHLEIDPLRELCERQRLAAGQVQGDGDHWRLPNASVSSGARSWTRARITVAASFRSPCRWGWSSKIRLWPRACSRSASARRSRTVSGSWLGWIELFSAIVNRPFLFAVVRVAFGVCAPGPARSSSC